MAELAAGTLIGDRYRIVRSIGQGAFGQTFLADSTATSVRVAIKVLHTQRAEEWKSFELFEREARVLSALRHHGVPAVHEVLEGEWDGGKAAFLIMEYVEGDSLAALIERRVPLDPADVTHYFLELLGILDYLHGRVPPILHRDIKPSNIIIRPNGFPALVDFGSVRSVIAPSSEGGSTIVGTYGYMPYEQHMGQASPSSDLYALAATFLHLLTGRTPPEFLGNSGRLEVPDGLPVSAPWRAVLGRMLQTSPAERFQNVREVRHALVGGEMTTTGAVPIPATRGGATTRRRVTIGDLPAVPRVLTGSVRERFRTLAPSAWNYLDTGEKPVEGIDVTGILAVGFFSLITLGVLPLILSVRAASRRSALKPFFRNGIPALAEITAIQDESIEFKLKLTRVRYEFEVDGELHRDADEVFASIANRWRPGDQVEILYLPERQFDSVIISVT